MEQADRSNKGKLKWSLVDYKSLEPMVEVLEFGARKYSKDNWKKGLPATEILESLLRHVYEMLDGNVIDEESGQRIIGHIMCNAMFLSYVLKNKPEFDDLGKKEIYYSKKLLPILPESKGRKPLADFKDSSCFF